MISPAMFSFPALSSSFPLCIMFSLPPPSLFCFLVLKSSFCRLPSFFSLSLSPLCQKTKRVRQGKSQLPRNPPSRTITGSRMNHSQPCRRPHSGRAQSRKQTEIKISLANKHLMKQAGERASKDRNSRLAALFPNMTRGISPTIRLLAHKLYSLGAWIHSDSRSSRLDGSFERKKELLGGIRGPIMGW